MRNRYCTFGDYSVIWSEAQGNFEIRKKHRVLFENLYLKRDGEMISATRFKHEMGVEGNSMQVFYERDGQEMSIVFQAEREGVTLDVKEHLVLCGKTSCDETWFAMSGENHDFLRAAYGTACTTLDDMLFDRETDTALFLKGDCGRRFFFHPKERCYEVHADIKDAVTFSFQEHLYADTYGIEYSPINKKSTFSKPPVGWMTWYAVKFRASEETVLENAGWMAEHLKKYGADAIWVDWEWYHKDLKGVRDDGVDTFHPDPEKYPNGLRHLSEEIKRLGFVPNLWVGFSTDPGENEYIKENPEIVLVKKQAWCGQYFFDFSHPKFLHEFLPRALAQVDDWGFEGVKFDALPISISTHEEFHDAMYDPSLTTKEAFRGMIRKTRDVLGKDRYLLSCCGCWDSDILWACDMFDAARVGGDIFNWSEFLKQGIGQTARYYPFHNIVFYNDPDNVVIREEYNDMEQAKSRVAFVSLLGLPITLGDHLPDLPEERVELLRRGIPAMDIRPMDLRRMSPEEILVTDLAVEAAGDAYHIVSVLNTTDQKQKKAIELEKLGMEPGAYLSFEYYASSFAEIEGGMLETELKPFETKVFAIRPKTGRVQLLGTTRHLTQGALEIEALTEDAERQQIRFTANLVEHDPYRVFLYVPDGMEIFHATVSGAELAVDKQAPCVSSIAYKAETGKRYDFVLTYRKCERE